LELTTHVFFAFAVGLLFFGRPDAALLVSLGALVPDLDREYWFVRKRKYQDEQPHRARFHNVFVIAAGYLLSPFFALGIFLHSLQDSFTTVKDRGCEWFYPLTRLVKLGTLDPAGNEQPGIIPGNVYFYQEDPKGIIEHADSDLQEPDDQPTPWRRVYGPALNSKLLDRGFLFGSIVLSAIWFITIGNQTLSSFSKPLTLYYPFIAGFAFFGLVYLAGELDRRDRKVPLRVIPNTMIRHKNIFKKPIFVAGVIFFFIWLFLYRAEILANLETLATNWIPLVLGAVSIAVLSAIVLKWEMKVGREKGAAVIV
jgi:hypothetical protein